MTLGLIAFQLNPHAPPPSSLAHCMTHTQSAGCLCNWELMRAITISYTHTHMWFELPFTVWNPSRSPHKSKALLLSIWSVFVCPPWPCFDTFSLNFGSGPIFRSNDLLYTGGGYGRLGWLILIGRTPGGRRFSYKSLKAATNHCCSNWTSVMDKMITCETTHHENHQKS